MSSLEAILPFSWLPSRQFFLFFYFLRRDVEGGERVTRFCGHSQKHALPYEARLGDTGIQGCSVTMEVAQDPAQRWEGMCGWGWLTLEAGERHSPLHPHLSSRVPWVLLAVLASLVLPVPRCVSCPLPITPAAGPYPTMPLPFRGVPRSPCCCSSRRQRTS